MINVNTKEAQGIANENNIQVIPTLKIFEDGKLKETFRGRQQEQKLKNVLDKMIKEE